MIPRRVFHSWNVLPKEAVLIQKELAQKVSKGRLQKSPRLIAGTDVSYDRHSSLHHAMVVILSYPAVKIVETSFATARVDFPYVPGLLSFREIPILLAAFQKLKSEPELVFCDGAGLAHPRRFGLACHLGLILDVPTVGVAKSPLCGEWKMPSSKRGSITPIRDGRVRIGSVVRTKDGIRPLFVSVGHRITLNESVSWVLKTTAGYRIPEPTRQAHLFANQIRQKSA